VFTSASPGEGVLVRWKSARRAAPCVVLVLSACGLPGGPGAAGGRPLAAPASTYVTATDDLAAHASALSVRPFPAAALAPRRPPPPPIRYPQAGDRKWAVAPGRSAVAGSAGRILRYRVAVEGGIQNLDLAGFARTVDATLADRRSWIGSGRVRLQRVGRDVRPDFTIYLATPATRDKLCGTRADGFTSCRNGDRVVVNIARWARGVPEYRGHLTEYRQYIVNHEVGHRLGRKHELCPGRGRPAPVMQQQTLGLHGCMQNSWPRIGGKPYDGPAHS
jgi:hypothetical protein